MRSLIALVNSFNFAIINRKTQFFVEKSNFVCLILKELHKNGLLSNFEVFSEKHVVVYFAFVERTFND